MGLLLYLKTWYISRRLLVHVALQHLVRLMPPDLGYLALACMQQKLVVLSIYLFDLKHVPQSISLLQQELYVSFHVLSMFAGELLLYCYLSWRYERAENIPYYCYSLGMELLGLGGIQSSVDVAHCVYCSVFYLYFFRALS